MASSSRKGAPASIAWILLAALALAGCVNAPDDGTEDEPLNAGGNGADEPEAPTAQPNPAQSGTNGPCLDYALLYQLDGLSSPADPRVNVASGTGFIASSADGFVQVDFFDADDNWVGYDTDQGTVPESAAYGVVCVTMDNDFPPTPVPSADWTYQDGF
jgi:hypothetical protein